MKDFVEGKYVYEYMVKSGFIFSIFVFNVLLNMYMKCGSFEDVCYVFDCM